MLLDAESNDGNETKFVHKTLLFSELNSQTLQLFLESIHSEVNRAFAKQYKKSDCHFLTPYVLILIAEVKLNVL